MSSARTVESPAGTANNSLDAGRKFPIRALGDAVSNSADTPQFAAITGPAASATVALPKGVTSIARVVAWTTATGVILGVKKEGVAFSVNKKNANGVATLTDLSVASHVAETWDVWFYADDPDGTVGGQSRATRVAGISQ